jgi:hypothetical protein
MTATIVVSAKGYFARSVQHAARAAMRSYVLDVLPSVKFVKKPSAPDVPA